MGSIPKKEKRKDQITIAREIDINIATQTTETAQALMLNGRRLVEFPIQYKCGDNSKQIRKAESDVRRMLSELKILMNN